MFLILLCFFTMAFAEDPIYSKGQKLAEELKLKLAESKEKHQKNEIEACLSASNLYIFMSFSVPDAIWLKLSKELETTKGMMILQGLPGNSFQQLAKKLYTLRLQGMNASVQLAPNLFNQFEIVQVPTFLVEEKESYKKLSGAVSLQYALEKLRNL